jgi:serine/threonine-protein kinase
MGRLWVAEHQSLQIEVAVKLLNPELASDEQWLTRFRQEAHAVAKIDSAHVVRVFDCGTTLTHEPFIVMELLRGEDLRRRIERINGLSLEEISNIVSQTCMALSRAHALGIVHRDLKPENIFLTAEGGELFVKLLDFGIAKHQQPQRMNHITDVNLVFGTPSYMSPEQTLSAGSVDHRADLWALSVVIFQMLTGRCPFVGPTLAAVGMKIQAGEFGLPSELRPELPKAVDAWFKRALSRDIEARFASADELFREFRRALLGHGTPVGPSVPPTSSYARTLLQRAPVPAPASAPAVEVAPLGKARRLPTFLAALSLIAAAVVGFVVVRNARFRPVETKLQASAAAQPVAASSTETDGEARPDSPSAQPDPLIAEQEASAPPIVKSEPRARPAHHAVKVKNALPAPATNAPRPPALEQKPLKDRGF